MSELITSVWGTFLENFWYLIVFAYGAIVGSFLNVLIYRMPLGMSVSKPPSHCPRCNTLLRFWDNIPIIAFLSLGGKCRYCRVPISWRYFGVELLTACLWTALFFQVADRSMTSWIDFLAQALFVSVLIAVIFIDLDHFIIPDELNWFGIALGAARDIGCLVAAFYYGGGEIFSKAVEQFGFLGYAWLPRFIAGALVYGFVMYLVSLLSFLVYARVPWESLPSAARRHLTMEDPPPAPEERRKTDSEAQTIEESKNESEAEEEELEGEPVRLRFSPATLSLASALVLLPVIHAWAALFFAVPFFAFVLLSRKPNEPMTEAANRFFQANDQGIFEGEGSEEVFSTAPPAEPEVLPLLPGDERLGSGAAVVETQETIRELSATEQEALLRAEADQFALEAEEGKHGGMGWGDVKLALAIGALLGPTQALLSLFFATFIGAGTGIIMARIHGRSLKLAIPFGPFMALGAIVAMLYGTTILNWYIGTFMPAPTLPPVPPMGMPR